MSAGARSIALALLGLWTFSCAVYQADEIPLLGEGDVPVAGGGGTSTNGGQISGAGTAPSVAGKSSGGTGGISPAPEEHGGDSAGGAKDVGGSDAGGSDGGGSGGNGGGGSGGSGGGASGSSGASGAGGKGGSDAGGSSGNGGLSGNGGVGGSGGSAGNAGSGGSSGNGGVGGGATAPTCDDHPLTASSTWTASASHDNAGTSPASNVLDGKVSRWTSGKPQAGDEWLQIDFGQVVTLSHVNLQQGNVDTNDYPRSYAVIVSEIPKDSSATPRVTGMGKTGVSTAIALPKLATGRYLLIKQLGTSLSWWSTQEVEVSCSN